MHHRVFIPDEILGLFNLLGIRWECMQRLEDNCFMIRINRDRAYVTTVCDAGLMTDLPPRVWRDMIQKLCQPITSGPNCETDLSQCGPTNTVV